MGADWLWGPMKAKGQEQHPDFWLGYLTGQRLGSDTGNTARKALFAGTLGEKISGERLRAPCHEQTVLLQGPCRMVYLYGLEIRDIKSLSQHIAVEHSKYAKPP